MKLGITLKEVYFFNATLPGHTGKKLVPADTIVNIDQTFTYEGSSRIRHYVKFDEGEFAGLHRLAFVGEVKPISPLELLARAAD